MKRFVLTSLTLTLSALAFSLNVTFTSNDTRYRGITSAAGVAPAALSEQASIVVKDGGSPLISLGDGHDLITAYAGDPGSIRALESNEVRPLSLASADLDEDGVPDLVAGYRTADGSGIVVVHRGNVDSIYPNSPEARQRRVNDTFTEAPFLSPALVFPTPAAVDFVGTGDFDGDSHRDVVAARREGDTLLLLSGDGRGSLSLTRTIPLQGGVTAMTAGEINRRDGMEDLVVAIDGGAGAGVVIFAAAEGALNAEPVELTLSSAATSLALADLDGEAGYDLAIAAGQELIIRHGRGSDPPPGPEQRAGLHTGAPAERVTVKAVPEGIRSLTVGNFSGSGRDEIAVLDEGGRVGVLTISIQPSAAGKADEQRRLLRSAVWSEKDLIKSGAAVGGRILPVRVSSAPTDDLLILGDSTGYVGVVAAGQESQKNKQERDAAGQDYETTLTELETIDGFSAALAMRLNEDALSDLVVLKAGHSPPGVIQTEPQAIFQVTTAADNGSNSNPTPNSLRAAIINANNNPGADSITFNIPGTGVRTISPAAALPTITGSLTIDGYSQPGASRNTSSTGSNATVLIELNGVNAGSAHGLEITAGNSVVTGLTINRFSLSGLSLKTSGFNRVEGNYIGVNPAGTAKLPNLRNGVVVTSADNTVGGTALAARNLLSGNGENGILFTEITSTRNKVEGNLIGTNASANAALGNTRDGVALFDAPGNTIGGSDFTSNNIIGGNLRNGVSLGLAPQFLVRFNSIGTNATGTVDLGNALDEISAGLVIGCGSGDGTVRDVIIAYNGSYGIHVAANAILRPNVKVFANGRSAILDVIGGCEGTLCLSLCCEVLPPAFEVTSATVSGSRLLVKGFYFHEFARNKSQPVDLYVGNYGGGGKQFTGSLPSYLGETTVTTDQTGLGLFTASFPVPPESSGRYVNAQTGTEQSNFLPIGADCSYSIVPLSNPSVIPAAGGIATYQIQTQSNCDWSITRQRCSVSFSVSSGTGPATVSLTLGRNDLVGVPQTLLYRLMGQPFTVTQEGAVGVNSTCSPVSIINGQTKEGTITDTDCDAPHYLGRKADVYSFAGRSGQAMRAIMIAPFEQSYYPFLILVGPDGKVIDYVRGIRANDIIFAELNHIAPTSGTYTLEATTSLTPERGSYSLSLDIGSKVVITAVEKVGKNLYITGSGFQAGAFVYVNGVERKGIEITPTSLMGKKAAKGITEFPARVKVRLQDGTESNEYLYNP